MQTCFSKERIKEIYRNDEKCSCTRTVRVTVRYVAGSNFLFDDQFTSVLKLFKHFLRSSFGAPFMKK